MKKVLCISLFLLMQTAQAMETEGPEIDPSWNATRYVLFRAHTDRGLRAIARVFCTREGEFEEGSKVKCDKLYFPEQQQNSEFNEGEVIVSRWVRIKNGEIDPSPAQELYKSDCPDPELHLNVLEGLNERYGIGIPEGLDPNNPRSYWEKLWESAGQQLGLVEEDPEFMKKMYPEQKEKTKQREKFVKTLYRLRQAEKRNQKAYDILVNSVPALFGFIKLASLIKPVY